MLSDEEMKNVRQKTIEKHTDPKHWDVEKIKGAIESYEDAFEQKSDNLELDVLSRKLFSQNPKKGIVRYEFENSEEFLDLFQKLTLKNMDKDIETATKEVEGLRIIINTLKDIVKSPEEYFKGDKGVKDLGDAEEVAERVVEEMKDE